MDLPTFEGKSDSTHASDENAKKKTNIYFTLPLCSPRITENSQPTRLAHWSVRGHVVFFFKPVGNNFE
jgi:hypothetical protein